MMHKRDDRMLALLRMTAVVLLTVAVPAVAMEPAVVTWTRAIGGSGSDQGFAVDATADGGFILAGDTGAEGAVDVFLVRLDAAGEVMWQRALGGAAIDRCRSVRQTSDGGFVLCGQTGIPPIYYDILLMKTDAEGRMQWQRTYGESGEEIARSVLPLADGGFLLGGDTAANEFYLVRTDATGTVVWERAFGGGDDHTYAVRETAQGDFVLCGYSGDGATFPEFDARLLKVSSSGTLLWSRTFGESIDDRAFDLQVLTDGGIAVTGNNGGNDTIWRFDEAGHLLWVHDYGTPTNDLAYALEVSVDGGFLLTGYTWGYDDGYQIYTVRTDASGQLLWESMFGGTGWEWARGAVRAADGGYLLVGTTDGEGAGGYDMYAVRLAPETSVTAADPLVMPTAASMDVFPNPFNPRLRVSLRVAQPGRVRVAVYDVAGRSVATLLDDTVAAGQHPLTWNGRDTRGQEVPSGIYVVRMETLTGAVTSKVSLIR